MFLYREVFGCTSQSTLSGWLEWSEMFGACMLAAGMRCKGCS